VGEDVLFLSQGGTGIYKNATMGYKWIPEAFVFTTKDYKWLSNIIL
jgi:hypothetical protein